MASAITSTNQEATFGRLIQDERLFASGYCDASGRFADRTVTLPRSRP